MDLSTNAVPTVGDIGEDFYIKNKTPSEVIARMKTLHVIIDSLTEELGCLRESNKLLSEKYYALVHRIEEFNTVNSQKEE